MTVFRIGFVRSIQCMFSPHMRTVPMWKRTRFFESFPHYAFAFSLSSIWIKIYSIKLECFFLNLKIPFLKIIYLKLRNGTIISSLQNFRKILVLVLISEWFNMQSTSVMRTIYISVFNPPNIFILTGYFLTLYDRCIKKFTIYDIQALWKNFAGVSLTHMLKKIFRVTFLFFFERKLPK